LRRPFDPRVDELIGLKPCPPAFVFGEFGERLESGEYFFAGYSRRDRSGLSHRRSARRTAARGDRFLRGQSVDLGARGEPRPIVSRGAGAKPMPIAIHWRRLLPAFLNRSATLPRAAPAPVFLVIAPAAAHVILNSRSIA